MAIRFRENEINEINRLRWLSEEQHTRVLLLTGFAEVGKSTLVKESLKEYPSLYFNMGLKSETLLCREFYSQAKNVIGLDETNGARDFNSLFDALFDHSTHQSFSVVINEFQRLPVSTLTHLADVLTHRKRKTFVNIILLSSDELMADRLCLPEDAVLYNCIDSRINLAPYSTSELRSIFFAEKPSDSYREFLYFYMVTGGMPGLVHSLDLSDDILDSVLQRRSDFLKIGERILLPRLGKNSEIYYSILQSIAEGYTSQLAIEERLGGGFNVGGHLAKLETVYGLVEKKRPAFSSESSRGVVRYNLKHQFLDFWFRYIESHRSDIEAENYRLVKNHIETDFDSYSKMVLSRYFRTKLEQEGGYAHTAAWWRPVARGEAPEMSEIPVVAYSEGARRVLLADVCLNANDFDKERFLKMVTIFRNSTGKSGNVDSVLFLPSDI